MINEENMGSKCHHSPRKLNSLGVLNHATASDYISISLGVQGFHYLDILQLFMENKMIDDYEEGKLSWTTATGKQKKPGSKSWHVLHDTEMEDSNSIWCDM